MDSAQFSLLRARILATRQPVVAKFLRRRNSKNTNSTTFMRQFGRVRSLIASSLFGGSVGLWIGINYSDIKRHLQETISVRAATTSQTSPPISNVPTPVSGLSLQPQSRASEIMRFGYPSFDNLKTFEDFVLSYDRRNRTANWVVEHLTPERMVYHPSVDRNKCQFVEDKSVHPYFRSTNEDYKKSGFDRGHLAAAGNHRKTQNAVDQTFLLSNMAPQIGKGFNRDKWNELEKHVRKLARRSRNLYVCTGPLYLPKPEVDGRLVVSYQVIGKNHVAVPTHFFKVILVENVDGNFELESYILPNQPIDNAAPLKAFQIPLESIERAAGILIFEKLPRPQVKFLNGKKT